ncbi:Uncharacterized protein GBIM_01349 [Gryllus bimaculatus]|nr:Uncharacterized protein GBIM_01349 [Gryllus bimaculatus]
MASRRANYVTGAASAQSLSEATGGASAASVIHATESKSPRRSAIEWYTVTGEYFLSQRGPVPGEGGGKVNQARLRRAGGSPAQPLPGPARRATAHAQPSPSLPPSSRPPPAEAHWHSGADTAQSAGERGLGRRGKHGLRCPAREKSRVSYTHLGLKAMIKEVDEDGDDKISFREFLLIYRKARAGELTEDSGLSQLAALTEINVEEVGVEGAKNFFEAKIEELRKTSKFEDEIRQEQEQRKREEEEKAQRRAMFKQRAAIFQSGSMQQT